MFIHTSVTPSDGGPELAPLEFPQSPHRVGDKRCAAPPRRNSPPVSAAPQLAHARQGQAKPAMIEKWGLRVWVSVVSDLRERACVCVVRAWGAT